MTRLFRRIPSALSCAAAAMLCLIVLLQVVFQGALSAYYTNQSKLGNPALFAAALIAIAFVFILRAREQKAAQNHGWALCALFAAVLAVELIIVRSCWFTMAWDPGAVHATALELASGQPLTEYAGYFDLCPNNAPLAIAQTLPLWVANRLGLAVPFVVLPYINAVLLNLSSFLAYACVRELTQSRTARLFGLLVSIGWIALSPYLLYPYTDTYSILFPVLSFYIWLKWKRPVLKWFVISLLSFFGASFKPTVLIFLIALAGVSAVGALGRGGRFPLKRFLAIAAVVVLGMLPGRLWQNQATAMLAQSAKPEGQLSATHYLMLGMNEETYGGHSPDDVAFSESFATLREREAANLSRAWERLSERGLLRNIRFFAIKAYKAYADGSFASHSSFLPMEIPKRNDALSVFLRSFYHAKGSRMPWGQTAVQCLWLGVLSLCAFAALRMRKKPAVSLLSLTLIGLTAYLLLFEVWPRYLFLYAPFFVILSSLAFDRPLSFKR